MRRTRLQGRSDRNSPEQARLITWTGAFLAATLCLAVWLAYEAVDSARSHRETAEAVVRDYVRVAAWTYRTRTARDVGGLLEGTFQQVPRLLFERQKLPELEVIRTDLAATVQELGCECPALEQPAVLLRLNLRLLEAEGSPRLSAPQLSRLADTLTAEPEIGIRPVRGLLVLPEGEVLLQRAVLGYELVSDSIGPVWAYVIGFDANEFGATFFGHWYRAYELVPGAISGDLPNDSLARVAVRSWTGAMLYQSAPPYRGGFSASDTMGPVHGRLVVEATIHPDAVSRLIIGGMPRSRLWLIVTLLSLTLAVGVVAQLQLRRERQLGRLRDAFVSGVSHGLRTPLAQIRMFAELQAEGKLRTEEERARAVSVINREAQRLTQLVENILLFSRLRYTGETSSVRKSIVVSELVAEVLEGFRSLASARQMTVTARIDPGLGILGDRDALHRVVLNLLDNAAKYGPAGQTIMVTAGRRGPRTWVAVEDEGPGIPAEDRERVWKAYLRLQRSVEAQVPGTGIGLAVVAHLVAAHGGQAWVEDSPGGGARFVIELPSTPDLNDELAPQAVAREASE
ncbi:MAG: HAMP domain-containing histidine kinase [Gemmatimonadetes bacterium]|nr:HAMP domain-containing histidine kinase [Gemmatimonadota bacterium]